VKEETKKDLKDLFQITERLLASKECSDPCDNYGICSMCSLKSYLDDIDRYRNTSEFFK
jgi:hypothetical protein